MSNKAQGSAVANRDGVDKVWLCFPDGTHEPTLEYMYLKVLGVTSLGLAWDLFLELHSEMCV